MILLCPTRSSAHCLGAVVLTWYDVSMRSTNAEVTYFESDRVGIAICELEGLGDFAVEGTC